MTGPAINITGAQAISFGSPFDGTTSAGFIFNTKIFQVVNNFSGRWAALEGGRRLPASSPTPAEHLRAICSFTFRRGVPRGQERHQPAGCRPIPRTSAIRPRSTTAISLASSSRTMCGLLAAQAPLWHPLRPLRCPGVAVYAARSLSTVQDEQEQLLARVGFSWSLDAENRTVLRALDRASCMTAPA